MKIIINKLKYNIGKVFLDLPKDEKHSYHLSLIDILMKYTVVVQYFRSLRDSIIRKYTNFADSEYYEYEHLDEQYRIVNESKELLKRIESFPFICNISLDSIDVVTNEDDPTLDHDIKITINYSINEFSPDTITFTVDNSTVAVQ